MIITIDGPSGSGKSSIAKKLAASLSISYFDTGAMYRAVAWYLLANNIPYEDEEELRKALKRFSWKVSKKKRYLVCGVDVTDQIRSEEISKLSSKLSALPLIRKRLVDMQKNFAKKGSCVFEGRDMGSVVFKENAQVKFFMTADLFVRAKRRYEQLKKQFPSKKISLQEIQKQMEERDRLDETRDVSPLCKTKDMVELDTSSLSEEEVLLQMKQHIPLKKMRFFYRMAFYLSHFMMRAFYGFRTLGRQHVFAGPAIIICNHSSYMDPPIAVLAIEEELHFLARKSLFRNPAFRSLIVTLKAHPIASGKGDLRAIKTALSILETGEKILIFPEGGRSDGKKLLPLEPGFAFLAYKAGCPILPMRIEGADRVWGKSRKCPKCSGKIICRIGPPILTGAYRFLGKKGFIDKLVEEAKQALQDLEK